MSTIARQLAQATWNGGSEQVGAAESVQRAWYRRRMTERRLRLLLLLRESTGVLGPALALRVGELDHDGQVAALQKHPRTPIVASRAAQGCTV